MDPRLFVGVRVRVPLPLGLYHMATHLSLAMDFGTAAMLRTYQVAGLAFIFIPSNVLCYAGIPREKNNQVSSMMNFVRNIGGSIGIALVSTFVTRTTQTRQRLSVGEHAERQSAFSRHGRGTFRYAARQRQSSAADATHQAYGRLTMMMQQQASALAFRDVVAILAIIVLCLVPIAFVMQRPAKSAASEAPPPH